MISNIGIVNIICRLEVAIHKKRVSAAAVVAASEIEKVASD